MRRMGPCPLDSTSRYVIAAARHPWRASRTHATHHVEALRDLSVARLRRSSALHRIFWWLANTSASDRRRTAPPANPAPLPRHPWLRASAPSVHGRLRGIGSACGAPHRNFARCNFCLRKQRRKPKRGATALLPNVCEAQARGQAPRLPESSEAFQMRGLEVGGAPSNRRGWVRQRPSDPVQGATQAC